MATRKKKTAAPPAAATSSTESARVTAAGEESLAGRVGPDGKHVVRTKPDMAGYSGSYIESATGETFALKMVDDDPHGHTYHLKNDLHFHAVNEDDFKQLFTKK